MKRESGMMALKWDSIMETPFSRHICGICQITTIWQFAWIHLQFRIRFLSGSEEDDKGRQAGLNGRPGKSSRRDCQQGEQALSNCNNWRGVTLLKGLSKILANLIIGGISDAVDQRLNKEQVGFRKGQGCMDQIFTLRNIIEQCAQWQRQLDINYVDFKKAFDSNDRESL